MDEIILFRINDGAVGMTGWGYVLLVISIVFLGALSRD